MSDDAIGNLIAEELKEVLEKDRVEVIVGETDIEYCLSCVEDGDVLFIIDATLYGLVPGTLSILKLDSCKGEYDKGYSQHQLSLIKLLNNCSVKKVSGYVIGIEVSNVDFGLEISEILKINFNEIKQKVYDFIISKGE